MYEENNLEGIIVHYGFDPYMAIEKHINEEIISKFDCLVSCHRPNHDEITNLYDVIQHQQAFLKHLYYPLKFSQLRC